MMRNYLRELNDKSTIMLSILRHRLLRSTTRLGFLSNPKKEWMITIEPRLLLISREI
jgi:hypothetical protein